MSAPDDAGAGAAVPSGAHTSTSTSTSTSAAPGTSNSLGPSTSPCPSTGPSTSTALTNGPSTGTGAGTTTTTSNPASTSANAYAVAALQAHLSATIDPSPGLAPAPPPPHSSFSPAPRATTSSPPAGANGSGPAGAAPRVPPARTPTSAPARPHSGFAAMQPLSPQASPAQAPLTPYAPHTSTPAPPASASPAFAPPRTVGRPVLGPASLSADPSPIVDPRRVGGRSRRPPPSSDPMSLSDSGATLTHPLAPPTPSPPVLPIRFTGSPNPSPSTNPLRVTGPPRSPGQAAAPRPGSSRRWSSSPAGGLLSPAQPPVRLDQSLAAAAALGDDELPIPASAADARRGVGKALEALRDRRAFMAQAQQLASPSTPATSVHSHIDSYAPSAYSTPAVQAYIPPGSRFVPRPSNPPSPNPSVGAFSAVAPVWYDTSPLPGHEPFNPSDVADGLSELGSDTPSVTLSALSAHYESSESDLDDSDSQGSIGDPGHEDALDDDDVDDDIETALATRQEQRFVPNPSQMSGLSPPIQDYSSPEVRDKFSDVYASSYSPVRQGASPRRRHKHDPSNSARAETNRRRPPSGPRDPGPLHRLQRYMSIRFGMMDADEDDQAISASGVLLLLILMAGTAIAIFFGLGAGLVQLFHTYRDARIESQPRPWRLHCATQPSFPHEMADTLAPVDMFVAVLSDTTPEAQQRRQLIRHTWGRLTVPQGAQGRPTGNVQVKFVLPQPSSDERGAVEMEDALYNDLALLDVKVPSRRQKDTWSAQLAYPLLKWASKHAHVPVLVGDGNETQVRWKVADYFVKTDDDTFVVLDELERHLRLVPRVRTVWGYQTEQNRVAGGTYALTTDLVEWIAKSGRAQGYQRGKEGDRLSNWLEGHPGSAVPYGSRDYPGQSVTFVSERCWMYDHPASGTPFSHGFLFPDQLRKIKDEVRYGLPASTVRARGGARQHLAYSTVTDHAERRLRHAGYISTLTGAERAEAMVEGGGRWALSGGRKPAEGNTIMQDVLLAGDQRIRATPPTQALRAGEVHSDPTTGLDVYPFRSGPGTRQMLGIEDASDSGRETQIRSERFGGYPHGGTVVVRNLGSHPAVFLETTLVLLGRQRTWPDGAGGAGSAWRAT